MNGIEFLLVAVIFAGLGVLAYKRLTRHGGPSGGGGGGASLGAADAPLELDDRL